MLESLLCHVDEVNDIKGVNCQIYLCVYPEHFVLMCFYFFNVESLLVQYKFNNPQEQLQVVLLL